MSLKDKLEIGLKPDAPYRPDNLPEFQRDDPACQVGAIPGNSSPVREARKECTTPETTSTVRTRRRAKPRRPR